MKKRIVLLLMLMAFTGIHVMAGGSLVPQKVGAKVGFAVPEGTPSIQMKSAADTVRFIIAGEEEGTMQVDCGDGVTREFSVKANDTTWVKVPVVNPDSAIKVYGVEDIMNYFYVSAYQITSLSFAYCSALKWLTCSHNLLTELDVTQMPELTYLDCKDNDISSLDFSNCEKLETLDASSNKNLSGISFTNCTGMKYIDLHGCQHIYSVDVSMLPALTHLSVDGTSVYSVNVSSNPELKLLSCGYTSIYRLDVSQNTKLEELYVSQKNTNSSKIRTLDVSNNPLLRILSCSDQGISQLDLSNNPQLASLFCSGNSLDTIDLSNNPNVVELSLYNNKLTFNTLPVPSDNYTLYYYSPQKEISLDDIEYGINGKVDLTASTYSEEHPSTYKMYLTNSFDSKVNTQLTEGVDYTVENGVITLLKAQSDSVYIEARNSVFPSLYLKTTKFMVLDSADLGQKHLALQFAVNDTVGANFTLRLAALASNSKIYVDFGDGEQKEFTIQSYISNWGANVKGQLQGDTIKVYTDKGVQLKEINLSSSKINFIDMSNSHALSTVNLSSNELTEIDLRGNTKIQQLTLDNNQLTKLDPLTNNYLTNLSCVNNQIDTIDVYGCGGLQYLKISNNKIKELNLRNCAYLTTLEANNNELEELDLRMCTELTDLRVADNNLTTLDLSRNTKLNIAWIQDNYFKFSTMPETTCNYFTYSGQKKVIIPTGANSVDLSSEYMIKDNQTTYTWKKSDGTLLFADEDYTISNGVTTFMEGLTDSVYCEMKNASWPKLTLTTTNVKPLGKPDLVVAQFKAKADVGTEISLSLAAVEPSYIYIDYGDGTLTENKLEHEYTIHKGTLGESKTVKFYTYEEQPCQLRVFSIIDTPLDSIDVTKLTELESLNLANSYLKLIDLSNNNKLTELTLSKCRLSSLDLSNLTSLTMLNLGSCGTNNFDLSNLTELKWLAVNDNNLEEINLDANSQIWWLNVSNNNLYSLDLSQLTSLREFYCSNNQLEEIDLSNQPDMTVVNMQDNRFMFSTLPVHQINYFTYAPQADIQLEEEVSQVDLSSENIVNSINTEYKWFTVSGTELVKDADYSLENGITTFLRPLSEQVYCQMTNEGWPKLTLKTTNTKVSETTGISNINVSNGNLDITNAKGAIVNVYSISGKLIISKQVTNDNLHVSVANGVYIVEVINPGHQTMKKKVIIK
ncbi:MAG: T9SS type A sorting domain-containing protein [Prevotella sp.]|jgi:Leucine-rich repeat (LRR) protein